MKIKVVVHTADEEGAHFPGEFLDMRESTAQLWIQRGWAIARPDLEPKVEAASEPEPEPDSEADAEIETAALPGGPENTLSERGRRGRPRKIV